MNHHIKEISDLLAKVDARLDADSHFKDVHHEALHKIKKILNKLPDSSPNWIRVDLTDILIVLEAPKP